MKYFIFKSPRKPGDTPLEVLSYEPSQFIIEMKAKKYQSIIIIFEEDLKKEDEK